MDSEETYNRFKPFKKPWLLGSSERQGRDQAPSRPNRVSRGMQDQDQTVKQKRCHQRRGVAETKILEQKLKRAKCYGYVRNPQ